MTDSGPHGRIAMARRLLVINPNTTPAMTSRVADLAGAMLPGVRIEAATGRFGGHYIASRATFAIAGHAALDAFAPHAGTIDAILLACFGDPGLDALREVAGVPVIGLVEAAMAEATAGGRRAAIVTGCERWKPMLEEMIAARGLTAGLAAVRTVAPTGGQIAADPEAALALLAEGCRACVREDGTEAVILGGAGLVGLAARVAPLAGVPVVCSVEAGIRAAGRALAEAPPEPGVPFREGVGSTGLAAPLERLLGG
jgi:Asp/Glu/hydantoin racemase